jgi:hypothetical protein
MPLRRDRRYMDGRARQAPDHPIVERFVRRGGRARSMDLRINDNVFDFEEHGVNVLAP